MYYLESGYGKHERLRNALIAALVFHTALIIGISFEVAKGEYRSPQIEVTLAVQPSSAPVSEARNIAQASQQGLLEKAEPEIAPPTPEEQVFQPPRPSQAESRPQPAEDVVASRNAARLVESAEVEEINRELADLEAQLEDQTRAYASMPRVRRLTSVATKEAVDAAYLHSLIRRLEAVGNKYYPEASLRYRLFGSVRLLMVVDAEGRLEDVRVLSSSGYAVLDEAAIKTVRMAAPYAPFPDELRATTDKLEIIRTWHFEQNRLSSN